MKCLWLLLFLLLLQVYATAQQPKITATQQQVWTGYFNQARFTDKWGLWVDIQLRTKADFVNDLSVSLNRFGLTYYLNNDTKLTAGYAFINFFPADNHSKVSLPEHRPWQQIQWHTNYGKKKVMQWIRTEERFRRKIANDSTLGDGNNFNFRVRYNILLDVPLSKKGVAPNTLSFIVNNELHINFGKQIVFNYFDQNRFFVGFKYQFTKQSNLQFGYMNLFQQLAAGNRYRNFHVARVLFFQNLDLRNKKG